MSKSTAELNLRTALSLVSETAAVTQDIQEVAKAKEAAIAGSWKETFSFWGQIGQLQAKLDQAITLAQEASAACPEVTTISTEDYEYSPENVIGYAYFQKGLLEFGQGYWKSARSWFEQSLSAMDHPSGRLLLAHVDAMEGYRQNAMTRYQQVTDMYPESEEAVQATMALADLRQMKPRRFKTALLLSTLLGWCGADRFYLGDLRKGFYKLITLGGLGFWWLIDIVRIATNSLRDINGMRLEKPEGEALQGEGSQDACPHCGSKIKTGIAFCTSCGAKLQ